MSAQRQPRTNHPEVEVDLPPAVVEAEVSAAEAVELAKELNVAPLPRRLLNQLKERGIELDNNGVIAVGNQMIYVTSEVVLKFILLIGDRVKTGNDAMHYAPALTSLAKALRNLTEGLTESLEEKGGNAPVASKANAFPGGAKTQLTQINFNVPKEQKT